MEPDLKHTLLSQSSGGGRRAGGGGEERLHLIRGLAAAAAMRGTCKLREATIT